jgi:hypothetical protein
MVLRRFDPAERCLTLHSDQRSPKLIDIAHEPRVAFHAYDAHAALQIRLSATAKIHTGDDVAHAAWAASAPSARVGYGTSPAPGTPVPAPLPAATDPEAGFANFAVLTLSFDTLEWLWLYHGGHRRAGFTWAADGTRQSAWLVP